MGPIGVPMLYPRDQQEDVPTGYPMRSRPLPMPAGDKQEAGPAITLWMPSRSNLSDVTARLTDSDGREAALWLSTPDQPAVAGFSQHWIGMIPKEALKEATTYTVTVEGKQGAAPWRKSWSFRTVRYDDRKERVAAHLLAAVNRARAAAALAPVVLDPELSHGCDLHAAYLRRNSNDPLTQGPGHARRAPGAPGYTAEGQRAGRSSVIANDSNPMDAVDSWLATLYHRVPLLHPSLTRIGLAMVHMPDQNWTTVLDSGSDLRRR